MKKFSVLITGASSGIGYATALSLAEDGNQVFAGVRKAEDSERIKKENSNIVPVILDVTKPEQISAALGFISEARDKSYSFSLVNNAGIVVSGPVEAVSMDDFRRQFEVNFFGLIAATQAFLPLIRESRGRIVNISSIAGILATPFLGPYCASKFAVEGLTDSLRRELGPVGVKVILIEPGSIETPIWGKGLDSREMDLARMNPNVIGVYENFLKVFETEVKKAEESASPVVFVVETIKQALLARFPRPRYLVGQNSLVSGIASYLPSRVVDIAVNQRLKHSHLFGGE